jgi:hypothetical protein
MDDQILTALVLILGAELKAQAERRGTQSTSDYTREAVRLIQQKQASILQLFEQRRA